MLTYLISFLHWLLGLLEGKSPKRSPLASSGSKRVVILGGGVSGVAAAFWLSAPEQANRYQVTLYTQGWRLGGKCATGRNALQYDRIEEHGLHVLMGCYQNAFTTIRACYDAWVRPPSHPFTDWQKAFLPQSQFTLTQQDGSGSPPSWALWNFPDLPRYPGLPGVTVTSATAAPELLEKTESLLTPVLRMAQRLLEHPSLRLTDESYAEAVEGLLMALSRAPDHAGHHVQARLQPLVAVNWKIAAQLEAVAKETDAAAPLAPDPTGTSDTEWLILANLGLTILKGYSEDIWLGGSDPYDALNVLDFRAWLARHGATPTTLASAPVRALYDLTFAYPNGVATDPASGRMAAGVTLRFVMEAAFGYHGAPLWRMAAGTGDTVFAPFYQVLQARGVSIQFFSRVTALRPSADGSRLGEIDISQQATVKRPPYRPLRPVGRLDCWPNQPDWSQLEPPPTGPARPNYELSSCTVSVGSQTLTAGTDFDLAIVAMPPAVLQTIAAPLSAVRPAWATALDASRSVATRALQLWMKDDVQTLGWPLGPTVLTAYAEAYDSWGDMSAVLTYENWPSTNEPKSLAYLCGCLQVSMTGPIDNHAITTLTASQAQSWLEQNIATLWPDAPPANTWWSSGAGIARYDRANYDPSDLYVQTPQGTNVSSRFDPGLPAGFGNVYVVGDWTKTRFSGGCFEAAVESAMLAANAITGYPPLASIKTG